MKSIDARALQLLASPVRQEICDLVEARGELSAKEIARELGRSHDAVYYHLRKLLDVGVLVSRGKREAVTRHEELYSLPRGGLRARVDPDDRAVMRAIRQAGTAALRLAIRDLRTAIDRDLVRGDGPTRNFTAGRAVGWFTRGELRRVNALLREIQGIVKGAEHSPRRRQLAFTWQLVPLEAQELER